MKRLIRNNGKWLIFAVTIVLSIWYLNSQREAIAKLSNISIWYVIVIALTSLLVNVTEGLKFKYNMLTFNIHLPFREWFGLTVTNTMYNYYLPAQGGMALRAAYLKKMYKFKYSHYVVMQAGAYALSSITTAIFFAVVFIAYFVLFKTFSLLLLLLVTIIGIAVMAGMIMLVFISKKRLTTPFAQVNKHLIAISEAIQIIEHNPRTVVTFMLASMANIISRVVRFMLAFWSLGITLNFVQVAILQSLSSFSLIISLTPGNIGIEEGLIGFVASVISINVGVAIVASLVARVVTTITTVVLGLFMSKYFVDKYSISST
jgi:uncharacterized protein (TIRG00374 family)